jgi:hypothetical protein
VEKITNCWWCALIGVTSESSDVLTVASEHEASDNVPGYFVTAFIPF